MPFIEVNESNIAEVLEKEFANIRTVIMKFGTLWCNACHALESELAYVNDKHSDIAVLIIDTDESPDLTDRHNIRLLPTFVVYKNSHTIIYRGEGLMPAQEIEAIIKGEGPDALS